MRPLRLFLVGLSATTRPVARAAARLVFPQAETVELATVEEAMQPPTDSHAELLVLSEPEAGAVARGIQAVDPFGRPRWAIVVLGRGRDDLAETVPPEDWHAPLVARVFRSALLAHELGCENARLLGDLRTVSRRISHDLYSPMGCISTCVHLLRTTPALAAVPPDRMIADNIEESLGEMAELIAGLSFLVRATTDPLAPTRVAMAEVVADVLDRMTPGLNRAGASVVQPAAWPEVQGVQPWLEVIWTHLVTHALEQGGPRAQLRLAWAVEGDGHRFAVIHRGPTIAPAIEAGLFKPFDQLHLCPGSSVGLAIVERLVALQGGRCAYARLGDGESAFQFSLPAAGAAPAP